MTGLQSPRDRILWILTNSGGRMDRSKLRRCAGIKLADLDPILAKLARDGRIEVSGEIAEFSDTVRPRYSCGWKGGRRKGFLYGILGPTPSPQDPKDEHE